jgi:hypothetical protein
MSRINSLKAIASDLAASIRAHVSERLEPIDARIRAADTAIGDLHAKINALEKTVAELHERLQIRRVA